jgi:type IV secretory pathway VirB10-like protein
MRPGQCQSTTDSTKDKKNAQFTESRACRCEEVKRLLFIPTNTLSGQSPEKPSKSSFTQKEAAPGRGDEGKRLRTRSAHGASAPASTPQQPRRSTPATSSARLCDLVSVRSILPTTQLPRPPQRLSGAALARAVLTTGINSSQPGIGGISNSEQSPSPVTKARRKHQ